MKKAIILFIIMITLFACKNDKQKDEKITGDKVILISNELFTTSPNDPLIISNATLENDSLKISFGASGCDSKSWIIELIGSEDILKSNPPQRSIRLSLKNNEACQAALGRTITFDLKPARISEGEIILNLQGWQSPITYIY
ncbi:MAG TPA: hypothetical protein VK155_09655 [Bacteroidales bacterium]|jgi:hypothetical protein|nr:hypothetical protein [Bacteroidales bacterium]